MKIGRLLVTMWTDPQPYASRAVSIGLRVAWMQKCRVCGAVADALYRPNLCAFCDEERARGKARQ